MGKGRRYDQDYKDMIVDLFKSGMSVSEISSEYGIAKSTINGWIKDVNELRLCAVTVKNTSLIQIKRL